MLVFSTHAFTEGDVLSSFFGWLYAISTHAFTEGDGVQLKRKFYWKRISTHAFTEGDNSSVYGQAAMDISTHAFTEGDEMQARREKKRQNFNSRLHGRRHWNWLRRNWETYFNSRLHGRRLQIQIIFAAKHFLFLLILSKFLILAFLFHLASLRFSLHPVIFPVRISLYFSVYLPFALETCTLCHNI